MANYLPVLLVSATNSIPDDSSVSTLPRGQVDYLSHDWEEEDVWRSWRIITRRKHEITNGIRLENASWRTWWKQRNKLGTISPETLNWLKDSDVTWLYGPLHKAGDWTPPPKPKPHSTSVDTSIPNSAHDRLDLSVARKPILKHRSISELLTSDLPSPLFSPAESESEEEDQAPLAVVTEGGLERPSRPMLMHTKSDTHVMQWGGNRGFRKDSPPRIVAVDLGQSPSLAPPNDSNQTSYFSPHTPEIVPTQPQVYSDVNYVLAVGCGEYDAGSGTTVSTPGGMGSTVIAAGTATNTKKKHISFNTFVEQCIAIEKPKKGTSAVIGVSDSNAWNTKAKGVRWDAYEDGYDDDEEDRFAAEVPVVLNASDSEYDEEEEDEDDEYDDDDDDEDDEDEEDEDDDDDVIEMRPATFSNTTSTSPRSTSKVSTSSSSSSTASNASISSPRRTSKRRKNSRSKVRPPLIRTNTPGEKEHVHVTIAPIAPTILKTAGVGNGWAGDGDRGWVEGFGEEGDSDDGLAHAQQQYQNGSGRPQGGSGGASSGGTYGERGGRDGRAGMSVELVYFPPLGSNYSVRMDEGDDVEVDGENVYLQQEGYLGPEVHSPLAQSPVPPQIELSHDGLNPATLSVPLVVRTPPAVDRGEEDAYDFFGGPDLGEDFARRRGQSGRRKDVGGEDEGMAAGVGRFAHGGARGVGLGRSNSWSGSWLERMKGRDDRKSRSKSRSRSRSRTPSPACIPTSTAAVPVPAPKRTNSFDRATSPQSTLLSPPSRGRGSIQDLQPSQSHSRGRSSTRTSSSFSDRERSSHSSPFGSLSPDGSAVGLAGVVGVGGMYANGRIDRERGRERRGMGAVGAVGGERGRGGSGRSSRSSSQSVSPEVDCAGTGAARNEPRDSSASSSASSSTTVVPVSQNKPTKQAPPIPNPSTPTPSTPTPMALPNEWEQEEEQRSRHPTPNNSPVISMSPAAAKLKPPLAAPSPHPATTSCYPVSPAGASLSRPNVTRSPIALQAVGGLEGDETVVGKAVGMVSTAGAYFGLWHGGTV